MLWAAESFYDGTWSSGRLPDELEDFELMHEFGWTWAQLQDTPHYVRRFCCDFLAAKREAHNDRLKRQQKARG